jgi:nicotinamidase-related amidase
MMRAMRGLLIIDIQRDYFPGGAYPLVDPEAAAEAAKQALDRFRSNAEPIVHMQHIWDAPDAPFFKKGTPGTEIHPLVAPADGETVITKSEANSFLGTTLEEKLRADGIDELVVAGMMSSMCVDASVRAGADLGFGMTVIHDGCAAPDLEFGGTQVPGRTVHAAFMAALGDGYAKLVTSDEVAKS